MYIHIFISDGIRKFTYVDNTIRKVLLLISVCPKPLIPNTVRNFFRES